MKCFQNEIEEFRGHLAMKTSCLAALLPGLILSAARVWLDECARVFPINHPEKRILASGTARGISSSYCSCCCYYHLILCGRSAKDITSSLLHPLPKTQSPLFHPIDMTLSLPSCLKPSAAVKLWKKNGSWGGGVRPWDFSGEKINRTFKSLLNERDGEVAGKLFSTPYRLFWGPKTWKAHQNQNQVFEWAVCIVNRVLRRAAKVHMGPFAVIIPPCWSLWSGLDPIVSASAPTADFDIAALQAAKGKQWSSHDRLWNLEVAQCEM